jgi:hypothetical protein
LRKPVFLPRPLFSSVQAPTLPTLPPLPSEGFLPHLSGFRRAFAPSSVRLGTVPTGKKRKIWKPNKVPRELVLGSDISLMETCNMALCGLVGRVSYHYLPQEPLQVWMDKNWLPIIGYSSRVFFLEKVG